jgi:hypothetical protein
MQLSCFIATANGTKLRLSDYSRLAVKKKTGLALAETSACFAGAVCLN